MTGAIKNRTYSSDLENDGNDKCAAEMVMRLFEARTGAHVQHLLAPTHAQHLILEELYTGIGDKADAIAEKWQGVYQMRLPLRTTPVPKYDNGDALSSLKVLREWMDANRDDCCDDEEIQALIDEAMMLIDGTLYKLKFLL